MAHLSLSFLGSFQATLDGQPITDFKSNKARALLAYLAVESDRAHRREVLAGLLWADYPNREALSNLRYTLSSLRGSIRDRARAKDPDAQPPFLLIARDTLQFNTASDYWLDVTAFTQAVEAESDSPSVSDQLQEAVALYRGGFLEGFSVADSPPFEEWALLTRERLARQVSSALLHLATACEQRGEYDQAQSHAWRQTELEPYDETAHQQLMRTLALGGQRSAALAQYETCRRRLAEELNVEPSPETTRLYEQIRSGELRGLRPVPAPSPDRVASLPPFLEEEPPQTETPTFVAREGELAQMERSLDLALAGQGQVVFVTGEAGSGKTTLVEEFARRAQNARGDLIVASGNCNAYTGIGDPYLPFREVLSMLTGDIQARWAAGAITRDHARRLWHTLPITTQVLIEAGPDLVDTFVPGQALIERTVACAPERTDLLARLDDAAKRGPAIGPGSSRQSDLFEQYTRVLQALAQRKPLLLMVDDLQWADLGSISLLFHLGRHLAGGRILIVGGYRQEEIALGRDGKRHPLEPVVNEFQRDFGNITVNLGQAEGRSFVDALLDSEPNHLGDTFREMLHQQTGGHPLFTTELLRGMQQRGDLVQDSEGRWTEGTALDWQSLPARVEAVIAERIGRMAEPLQGALRVACIEGEMFTAEVVARVQAAEEQEMVDRLSGELDKKHRLVCAQGIARIDGQRLSHYRFRHILFQKYLYNSLDDVERAHLHEAVGNTLEALYQDQVEAMVPIAGQLAWHFGESGIARKAIHYLRQAGERATRLSAFQEALAHLTNGLELLMTLPESPERAEQELALQLSLGMAWTFGSTIVEGGKAYTRAHALCQQIGRTSELPQIVGMLTTCHYVGAQHRRARELAEEALDLAQQVGDPMLVATGHWRLGFVAFALGEYTTARAHLEPMMALYEPRHHRALISLCGSDPGPSALAYDACCLWCLGYPEQALKRSQDALALAREIDHSLSLVEILHFGGCMLAEMRRDAQALKSYAEELMQLASEKGLQGFLPSGICFRGEALVGMGQVEEGMAQLREGMAAYQARGERINLPRFLYSLAEAQAKMSHPEEGLSTLSEALALVEQTDERYWEAELYRLRAELLLLTGNEDAAEDSANKAIEVARHQQAKSWELQAMADLARLWQRQGKADRAREALAEVYGWFTEGFDATHLIEAKALLDSLS
jgi:DNA-binding SARP family transcriptional activator/predicted ATPase/energy-coupling factor transporter ATP-binding protein EcfA2